MKITHRHIDKSLVKASRQPVRANYGWDSNGDAIDESEVEELYRVANNEVLAESSFGIQYDAEIREDSWNYGKYSDYGASVDYEMYVTVNDSNTDMNAFVYDDEMHPAYEHPWITFILTVKNIKINPAVIIYDSEWDIDEVKRIYVLGDIVHEIIESAEPVVRDIYGTVSNI